MPTTPRSRVAAVTGLIALLFALCVWYGSLAPAPEAGAYPDQNDLAEEYDRHVGDRATVSGRVVDTSPVAVAASVDGGGTLRVTVADLSVPVAEGETLRVYGVVEPGRTVRAIDAVAVAPGGTRYAVSASFLAGLWVLARVVRHWRVDADAGALERRGEGSTPGLVGRVRNAARGREDEDA